MASAQFTVASTTHMRTDYTAALSHASDSYKAAKCDAQSGSQSTSEYLDDTLITVKIKALILQEPTVKSRDINVETFKGVVRLNGFVNSATAQSRAVEIARGVSGVKSVKDDMQLE